MLYIWFADPFNLRPFINMLWGDGGPPMSEYVEEARQLDAINSGETNTTTKTPDVVVDKNPGLSAEEEAALERIGIDPANLPSTMSPEMESCFVKYLGSKRVEEIKDGATPTFTEVFKTRECYE